MSPSFVYFAFWDAGVGDGEDPELAHLGVAPVWWVEDWYGRHSR